MTADPSARSSASSDPVSACDRRGFLKAAAAALPLTAAATAASVAGEPKSEPLPTGPVEVKEPLPQIRLGKHSVSRLICGNNCFGAGSHLSVFVNKEMRAYYTPEQVLRTLRRCEQAGINAWQASCGMLDTWRRYLDTGGKMQFLTIETDNAQTIAKLAAGGCIGSAHHGEATDSLFKQGKLEKVGDFLKRVRDAGLQAGVSTHMPDVVDAVESKGWEVDYYMTCLYERHRSRKALTQLLGHVPIPVGEVYLESDPPRMFKAIQATKRPCLAFKILAAGRLCERIEIVDMAFRETFAGIKPTDAVIVGIYDKFEDQPAQDAAFVRRYGRIPGSSET